MSDLPTASEVYDGVRKVQALSPEVTSHLRKLHCEYVAFMAQALLESNPSDEDRRCCLQALNVMKGIAYSYSLYVYGLSRDHSADWQKKMRWIASKIDNYKPKKRKSGLPIEIKSPSNDVANKQTEMLPNLAGKKILVVGFPENRRALDDCDEGGPVIKFMKRGTRRAEAQARRVRAGYVDAVVLRWGQCDHKTSIPLTSACKETGTILIYAALGDAGLSRALSQLDIMWRTQAA